ncbi:hypothetical protein BaRGS_00025114, partial [Batillaria attramentaria]
MGGSPSTRRVVVEDSEGSGVVKFGKPPPGAEDLESYYMEYLKQLEEREKHLLASMPRSSVKGLRLLPSQPPSDSQLLCTSSSILNLCGTSQT